jgi:hypothetical protein
LRPDHHRVTRAGYPVFTPYGKERAVIDNLPGIRGEDFDRANEAIGASRTRDGCTSEDDLFSVAPGLETFLASLSEDDDEPAPPAPRRGLGRLSGWS